MMIETLVPFSGAGVNVRSFVMPTTRCPSNEDEIHTPTLRLATLHHIAWSKLSNTQQVLRVEAEPREE